METHNAHQSITNMPRHRTIVSELRSTPTPPFELVNSAAGVGSTRLGGESWPTCWKRSERGLRGGCTHVMHGQHRMTIDPHIPTTPGRSTSSFHRPGSGLSGGADNEQAIPKAHSELATLTLTWSSQQLTPSTHFELAVPEVGVGQRRLRGEDLRQDLPPLLPQRVVGEV